MWIISCAAPIMLHVGLHRYATHALLAFFLMIWAGISPGCLCPGRDDPPWAIDEVTDWHYETAVDFI